MRISKVISVVLSTVFVAQQVSCIQEIAAWWDDVGVNATDIKEVQASVRVPVGSDPEQSYWTAVSFNTGQIGIQRASGDERQVIFSFWGDLNGNGSVTSLQAGDKAKLEPFTKEDAPGSYGDGTRGVVSYDWKAGESLSFKVTAESQPDKGGSVYSGYYSSDEGKTWDLVASFFSENIKYLTNLASFLDQLDDKPDNTDLIREGFWGNASVTTTDGKVSPVNAFLFGSWDYKQNGTWEQKSHIGPNNEIYQRIGGTKDQGIYPPTNTYSFSH